MLSFFTNNDKITIRMSLLATFNTHLFQPHDTRE